MSKNATPIEYALGAALRRRRNAVGLSQEELSFEANLHRTYIGAVERGEKNLTVRNLVKIAAALRISSSEILSSAGL